MYNHAKGRGFHLRPGMKHFSLLKSLRHNIFDKNIFDRFDKDIAHLAKTQLLSYIAHLHGYSYYAMYIDANINYKRHMPRSLDDDGEATEKNTEFFIHVNRFERMLDSELTISKA